MPGTPTLGGMRAPSPIGLLLDVDGPVASTETRTVPEGIVAALVRLAARGVPVGFNTGRSADFLLHSVIAPLRAAGLPEDAPFHAVCEKGAVWFPLSAVPAGPAPEVTVGGPVPAWLRTDPAMAVAADVRDAIWERNAAHAGDLQFVDRTKLAMVSLEKAIGADQAEYEAVRDAVAAGIEAMLAERGLAEDVRVDPTVISVDVEHRASGKDLGVDRCRELLAEAGMPEPRRWLTAGDSRTDYAMADRLHALGADVAHLDVRPADGVPATPYPVLTAADLAARGIGRPDDVHERAGESLLRWVERDLLD